MNSRRGFLLWLGATLITAPAIVRAGSLMPVKAIVSEQEVQALFRAIFEQSFKQAEQMLVDSILYGSTYRQDESGIYRISPSAIFFLPR
jgi:hypothetical protein